MNNGLNGDATNGNRDYPGIGHLIPTVEIYTDTASIPSAGATATLAHGLSGTPQSLRVVLECTDAGGDQGYVQGDEVDIGRCEENAGTGVGFFGVRCDATNIKVLRVDATVAGSPSVMRASDGLYSAAMDFTKWQLKAYAVYFAIPETAS